MRTSKIVSRRAASCLGLSARRCLGNEQGLALVMTLFVVALVTVLVLEYHFDAAVEIDLAANYASDVQAYHLALAGVRFAQVMLQRDDAKVDGPDDSWYKLGLVPACFAPQQLIELAGAGVEESLATPGLSNRRREDVPQGDVGCVSLRITDEDSKLPINALMPPNENTPAPEDWVRIFEAFLVSFKIDPAVVEAFIDWLDSDERPRGSGAERAYYEHLPVPYKPADGRMRTPGELRLVKGLDNPEELVKLFPGATPESLPDLDISSNAYLTTFGAEQTQSARVNLNTAAPEVLTALITGALGGGGGSGAEALVQDIVTRRQEKQFKNVTEAVPDANLRRTLSKVADIKSKYFRVESVGVVGIVHKKIVAVLTREQPPPVQAILYFKAE